MLDIFGIYNYKYKEREAKAGEKCGNFAPETGSFNAGPLPMDMI
jgi:hypothetical protein